MKNIQGNYIFAFLFLCNNLNAEIPHSSTCGMPSVPLQTTAFSNIGGRHLTSEGTITSFVLFVRFADDTEVTTSWPNASVLPTWAQNILNQSYSATGSYTSNSFSQYIYHNSYGKLHIVGDVFYVTLPFSESFYHQNAFSHDHARAMIQIDAFDQLALIPGIDLSKYDNWKRNYDFSHTYTGIGSGQTKDNIADMCWVIMRNFHDGVYNPTIVLGQDIALLFANKTIGGTSIQAGFPGSGISMFMSNFIDQMPRQTVINAKISEMDNNGSHFTVIGTMIHELSHYFFGGGHFGSINIGAPFGTNRSASGMSPYACNSGGHVGTIKGYEKIRLGWITSSEIKIATANEIFSLQDMTTSTSGFKIAKIPLDANQSIFLENRSWVSPYEVRNSPENYGKPLKPGIFAYLIANEYDYLSSTSVQQICADGKWDWARISGTGLAGPSDVIIKSTPNSYAGYDEKERIFISAHPGTSWLALYFPNSFGSIFGKWYKGDNYFDETRNVTDYHGDTKDLYGVGEVITKWSNGASHKRNPASTGAFISTEIGIEFLSYNSSTASYSVEVRIFQPHLLSPSKPQNVKVEVFTGNGDSNPRLTWFGMTEPDVVSGGFIEIQRSRKNQSSQPYAWSIWSTIATISGAATSYIDQAITTAGMSNDSVKYQIRAKDSQNKYSVYSNEVTMNYSQWLLKQGASKQKPEVISLSQNHPNPFNPITTIRYQIPDDAMVSIVVYSILGKEVAALVNGLQSAGYYEKEFDASHLPSGVYLYRITSGNFTETRKMLVNK